MKIRLGDSKRVTSWNDFIKEWNTFQSIPARSGLLYHGVTIEEEGNGDVAIKSLYKKVNFYHEIAYRDDMPSLSDTAQQLLLKHVLPEFPRLLWTAGRNPKEVHNIYVIATSFLEGTRLSISKPPYPRFVRIFLRNLIDYISVNRLEDFFNLLSLIKPAIAWGCTDLLLSHKLSDAYQGKVFDYLNREMESLLPSSKNEMVLQIFFETLREMRECSDITQDKEIVKKRAYLTYLILQRTQKSL